MTRQTTPISGPLVSVSPRRLRRRARKTASPVVVDVERQTAEAQALASISGQDKLMRPETNPAVRAHFDALRDDEHTQQVTFSHGRRMRRLRVDNDRAEDAELALRLIRDAKQMSSPARAVLALHRGRRLFMTSSLTLSTALSVGSATGIAAFSAKHGAGHLPGYIGELGLTGLSTMAILYRSHVASYGAALKGWTFGNLGMWALATIPLAAGATINALSHGVVGVACATGAAAFSTFSYIVGERSSVAMQEQAKKVTDEAASELMLIAQGSDVTWQVEQAEDIDVPVVEDREVITEQLHEQIVEKSREVIEPEQDDESDEVEDEKPTDDEYTVTEEDVRPAKSSNRLESPRGKKALAIYRESVRQFNLTGEPVISARALTAKLGIKNTSLAGLAIAEVRREIAAQADGE